MTRSLRIVITLCLSACLLPVAGCGDAEEENPTSVTIWWAQWEPAEGLQELGDEFAAETGIDVKVHQIGWPAYQDQVFLNFGNRTTDFDIVVGDSQWLGRREVPDPYYGGERGFEPLPGILGDRGQSRRAEREHRQWIGRGATKGLYLELTDWIGEAVDMDTIHPLAVRYLCEYPPGSGRYYAAPCETDAVGFAYRRDWFEDPAERAAFRERYGRELAVPETWEEFREVAEFFTRPDQKRYGCALLTGRGYDSLTMGFQHFLWDWGARWGDRETFRVQGHVNSPRAVEGLTFMKELMPFAPEGATNFDYSNTLQAFMNGSVAMAMDYFAFFPGIVADEEMGEKAGFFMVPQRDGVRYVSLGGQGMSISAKISPQRQELARKFIAWFCRTETQRKWITKPAGFTANTEILAGEAFRSAAPYNEPFARSMDHLRDFWNVPEYNELLAVSQRYVGEALDGVKSPDEALDALADDYQDILDDAGYTE